MPTALITGGTTGIGRATAQLLLERGYRVAVTGRNPDTVASARAALDGDVLVLRSDSASVADIDALVADVGAQFGALDLLFLNAGVFRPGPVADVTESEFDAQVDVNFKGQFFTLQRALPILNDGGSIVMTVGLGASRGSVGAALGAGTRGALLAMLPSLAVELAPRRIRVNAVSPGMTDTPLLDKLGVPQGVRDDMATQIPLGRFATGRDIAETVAFLASDAAGYITGQEITVAGGHGLSA
jgi:NAD(P)-dependent dehydrogenase (short-subunit alcohol dehydrogenase family)